jgi:hypothetical protein
VMAYTAPAATTRVRTPASIHVLLIDRGKRICASRLAAQNQDPALSALIDRPHPRVPFYFFGANLYRTYLPIRKRAFWFAMTGV